MNAVTGVRVASVNETVPERKRLSAWTCACWPAAMSHTSGHWNTFTSTSSVGFGVGTSGKLLSSQKLGIDLLPVLFSCWICFFHGSVRIYDGELKWWGRKSCWYLSKYSHLCLFVAGLSPTKPQWNQHNAFRTCSLFRVVFLSSFFFLIKQIFIQHFPLK